MQEKHVIHSIGYPPTPSRRDGSIISESATAVEGRTVAADESPQSSISGVFRFDDARGMAVWPGKL
jgi:hypothetical protein